MAPFHQIDQPEVAGREHDHVLIGIPASAAPLLAAGCLGNGLSNGGIVLVAPLQTGDSAS